MLQGRRRGEEFYKHPLTCELSPALQLEEHMWREYLHWTAAATRPVPPPTAPQPSLAPLLSLATRFMAAQVPAMQLQAVDFQQLPPLQVSLLHAGVTVLPSQACCHSRSACRA